MSMKAWAAALCTIAISAAWIWGMLTDPQFVQTSLMFQFGYVIPSAAIVLLPSGIVAAITNAVTKNSGTAMKTWWALSILIIAFQTVGALNVVRLS